MTSVRSDSVTVKLTPHGFALIDREDFERVDQYQWRLDISHGYVYTNIFQSDGRRKKQYLHRFITNCPAGMVVDHINRNKKDNRKSNLNIVTQRENAMYQVRTPHHASKYIGVRPSQTGAKWRSSIAFGGKEYHVGRFDNRHDAAAA